MIFVLITTRAGDVQYLRERVKDNIAREQLEALDNGDGPVLN